MKFISVIFISVFAFTSNSYGCGRTPHHKTRKKADIKTAYCPSETAIQYDPVSNLCHDLVNIEKKPKIHFETCPEFLDREVVESTILKWPKLAKDQGVKNPRLYEELNELISDSLEKGYELSLACDKAGSLVALATWKTVQEAEGKGVKVKALLTHPLRQGQGAGTAVIQNVSKTAKELNAKYVRLVTAPDAKEFYKKLGFGEVGTNKKNETVMRYDIP